MTNTPKTDWNAASFPQPPMADYSDELTTEHWEALKKLTEEFQANDRKIVSGEPW
ncbi:MAG TPA: hypothetical protein PKV67_15420 [Hyphomonas sp.]|nr:hypothetical protein [Hyphomonas sp.]HRK68524.1 hypothetical protein [Hyphomonas sp.]